MRWPKDPSGPGKAKVNRGYRFARRLFRSLVSVWFREINIVDDENIPPEGGVIFIAWHPSGLIDPMLLNASLPGKISIIAKHTLFKLPVIGRLLRSAGGVPIERAQDSNDKAGARARNAQMLGEVSSVVANGGRLMIFPEGTTHADSGVRKVRSGAGRILLAARREAIAKGLPEPHVVPIGLHYSNSQRFRERAAVVIERSMEFPALPELVADEEVQDQTDRAWVVNVTEAIGTELERASLSKTSWRERTLIWKGRSLAYAERARMNEGKLEKPTYAQAVLGARRVRAGWDFMALHKPELASEIVEEAEAHFESLEHRDITPYDVDARPERLSASGFMKALFSWLWAGAWMFGLISWGAMLGNIVPYKANAVLVRRMEAKGAGESIIGTIKLLSAIVFFPLWWILASMGATWLLLNSASPVNELLQLHWLLQPLADLPYYLVFCVFFIWWPVSAKAHLKLFAKVVVSYRALKRWQSWRNDEVDWEELVARQRRLAGRLVGVGEGLVLPGDPDWVDPPAGQDDVVSVRLRASVAA
jgi:1-acyl-sn-glycerol-3-phosphate acyltransferase